MFVASLACGNRASLKSQLHELRKMAAFMFVTMHFPPNPRWLLKSPLSSRHFSQPIKDHLILILFLSQTCGATQFSQDRKGIQTTIFQSSCPKCTVMEQLCFPNFAASAFFICFYGILKNNYKHFISFKGFY